MDIQPVVLNGKLVQLVPLDLRYTHDLTYAGSDERIWKYMRYGNINSEERMEAFIRTLLDHQMHKTDLPFAVVSLESGKAIGMTRYMNIEINNRALEIGGTWYGVEYQRTGVNTECKYLLLRHAFETLGCIRVQIKADLRNEQSQHAIERIGAIREGVLRDHMILPDGTVRSSVFYSILANEWPGVKERLETFMNQYREKIT